MYTMKKYYYKHVKIIQYFYKISLLNRQMNKYTQIYNQ